jgi:hypothetical protein
VGGRRSHQAPSDHTQRSSCPGQDFYHGQTRLFAERRQLALTATHIAALCVAIGVG